MTTLIKIKRDSIKKNPNAGRDTYHVPMPWQVTFETDIRKDYLPDWLQETVTEWDLSGGISMGYLNGVDDKVIEYVQSVKKDGHRFSVEYKREIQEVRSIAGEPEYLYEYANTKVKCSNCKKMIPVNDIEMDDDVDGNNYICPKCKEWNTFDFGYESIEHALKNK
jgi:Zn finger protein HypA/HybF involved in hydrogenase expression